MRCKTVQFSLVHEGRGGGRSCDGCFGVILFHLVVVVLWEAIFDNVFGGVWELFVYGEGNILGKCSGS